MKRTLLAPFILSLIICGHASGSEEQLSGNKNGPETVIAIIPSDSPPTYFRNRKTGKADGFSVDVMNAIAARAGLRVEYVFDHNWTEIIEAIRSGRADVAPGMGVSPKRKEVLAFSEPIDAFPVTFFVRTKNTASRVIDQASTVGAIAGSVAAEHLRGRPGIHNVPYHSFAQGLFDLLAGKIDAFACPAPTLIQLARESGVEDRIRIEGDPITEIKRTIAVRKGNTLLLARLNKAIEGYIGSAEYQKVYSRWYGHQDPFWTPKRMLLFSVAAIIAVVVSMSFWRYRSLMLVNRELRNALAEIKTLSGLLPICTSCKNIRDDKGYWNRIESYISQHTQAEFSHGICPACAKKLYPKYVRDEDTVRISAKREPSGGKKNH